jgi:hypothetical protein
MMSADSQRRGHQLRGCDPNKPRARQSHQSSARRPQGRAAYLQNPPTQMARGLQQNVCSVAFRRRSRCVSKDLGTSAGEARTTVMLHLRLQPPWCSHFTFAGVNGRTAQPVMNLSNETGEMSAGTFGFRLRLLHPQAALTYLECLKALILR